MVNYSCFIGEAMVLMWKPSVFESRPVGPRKRPLDGISRVQKVASMEKCFHGCLCWFGDIWVYIGKRIRSRSAQGAHKGGGHALRPFGRLVASVTCTPSPLDVFWSKRNHRESFIPFGLCLVFLFCETRKQGKKQKLALGSRLIG